MQRGCPWAGGSADDSHFLHPVEFRFGYIELVRGQAAGMSMYWGALGGYKVFYPVAACTLAIQNFNYSKILILNKELKPRVFTVHK